MSTSPCRRAASLPFVDPIDWTRHRDQHREERNDRRPIGPGEATDDSTAMMLSTGGISTCLAVRAGRRSWPDDVDHEAGIITSRACVPVT
jgi:hypothetical protein